MEKNLFIFFGKCINRKKLERVSLYHFGQEKIKMKNGKKNWFVAIIEWVSLEVQKFLKIDRTKYEKNIEYKYGANWFSITNKLAEFIIEKEY